MASVTDLIAYYVNLLIVQYHNQPKAQATIQLFAETLLASNIITDVQNAYDIDTAVGKQLDVIGKYVGVDRFYSELELTDYFSLVTYDEVDALPDSPPRFGFSDYSDYDDFAYNGTLDYSDIITTSNALFDSDYRILIKLKIAENNMNYSHKSIDDLMFEFFGSVVRPESSGNMAMQYFIEQGAGTLITAILLKGLLPSPMGVGVQAITDITGEMFAFTDYTGYMSPFGYGFTDYSDYDSLAGLVLTYDQITEA
jgi:hypothetical protein